MVSRGENGPRKLSRGIAAESTARPVQSGAVAPTDPCWLFGYGSLIFRPAIPFVERRPARVRGWTRRFWQWSTDHRGEPWRPGRVVTLVPAPEDCCWGMVYRLAEADADAILADLDVRERGGYVRMEIEVELHTLVEQALAPSPASPQVVAGLTYQGWPGNRNYAGPAPIDEIASQVILATGPSGTNADYVRDLDAALNALGVEDTHVVALAARLGE